MNKKILIALALLLTVFCTSSTCTHVHDDFCKYDEINKTGCTHNCELDTFGLKNPQD